VDADKKERALEWLRFAKNDLAVATHLNDVFRPLPENTICWLSQQAVEKSLKAILSYHNAKIKKIHDIGLILKETTKLEPSVTIDDKIAAKITVFAVESRYPDNVFDFTKEDAELGLKYAARVLDQVKQALKITDEEIAQAEETAEESPK
jgi:HEPN domain-containing protein